MTSQIALKEWAVVVEAMFQGHQMLLVRKGGIRDPKGTFQLDHREFLLYPTWEHQSEALEKSIRPEFRERFRGGTPIPQTNSPTVSLTVYAGVAFCSEIRDPKRLVELTSYHIWTPEFFEARMKYRQQSPTLVVLVRAYRLKNAASIPVKPEYAGCKSWVPLSEAVPVEGAEPVIDNRRFRQILEEVSARF